MILWFIPHIAHVIISEHGSRHKAALWHYYNLSISFTAIYKMMKLFSSNVVSHQKFTKGVIGRLEKMSCMARDWE